MHPKYLRYSIWDSEEHIRFRTERIIIMALGTEAAAGLLIFEECGRIGKLNKTLTAHLGY